MTLSLDGGDPVTVTLNEGSYTQQELAAEVQRAINTRQEFTGRGISATVSNESLVLTSTAYGSDVRITLESGSALSVLGFSAGATDIGQDVVGKFIVNGVEEKATGNGQLLAGDSRQRTYRGPASPRHAEELSTCGRSGSGIDRHPRPRRGTWT